MKVESQQGSGGLFSILQRVPRTVLYQLGGNHGCMLTAWSSCRFDLLILGSRKQVRSFDARVSDLEKLRQREEFRQETLRDLPKQSHVDTSFVVVESESLEVGVCQYEEEVSLEGMSFLVMD